MTTCDCLTSEDPSLPHYVHCALAGDAPDNGDIRCLAELAAYRDIDTALHVLRLYRGGRVV